jgi:predicted RNA-binding Zn-ribbon protein involved in translation (DUF1610 family)
MNAKCNRCGKKINFIENQPVTLICPECGKSELISLESRKICFTCARCGSKKEMQSGIPVETSHEDCNSSIFILSQNEEMQPIQAAQHSKDDADRLGYLQKTAFVNGGSPKVAWIQDLERLGGAELSNITCIEVGERLGFNIIGITPKNFHEEILAEADLFVINNFWLFSKEQRMTVFQYIFEDGKPYIKYEHDYREIEYRSKREAWRLFRRARKVFFISPKHDYDYSTTLGINDKRKEVLPLAIDVDAFHPSEKIEREKNLIFCMNGFNGNKGGNNIEGFAFAHPQYRFHIYSPNDLKPKAKNIEIFKIISHEEMPSIYSKYSGIAHLPSHRWAGERIVFEALLCGCKELFLNDNVGHKSWGDEVLKMPDEELREWLRSAPYKFWKAIEESCL